MFKIILSSLKKPQLLIQVSMLSRKFIIKLVLTLALIVSIPTIITNMVLVSSIQHDLTTISTLLPQFSSSNGILISSTHPKTLAVQTDTSYFLYDIENTVDSSQIEALKEANTVGIFLTKTTLSSYVLQVPLHQLSLSQTTVFNQETVKMYLQELKSSLNILYFIVPIFTFLLQIGLLLINNLLFTTFSSLALLLFRWRARFKHLFRTSLILSFAPYTILTVFGLFGISVPFHFGWLGLFIVTGQFLTLKDVLKRQ